MKNRVSMTAGFAMDMFKEGMVPVPVLLMRSYAMLEITETELVVIIHFLHLQQIKDDALINSERLASMMNISSLEAENCFNSLSQKKFLSKETIKNDNGDIQETYSLLGLFDRLSEVWAHERIEPLIPPKTAVIDSEKVNQLQEIFEKEFGRLLSPMEMGQIITWCNHDSFSTELIEEALRLSVLRGVLNFRYVDSILREWKKNGVMTVREARQREKEFLERKANKSGRTATKSTTSGENKKSSRFKNLYMN